jgi:hypothetical protein
MVVRGMVARVDPGVGDLGLIEDGVRLDRWEWFGVRARVTAGLVDRGAMTAATSFIAAVAGSLAAVLAAVNLYLSGRRERIAWLRESLVEVLVGFLSSSFETGRIARELTEARLAGGNEEDLTRLGERLAAVHREQTTTLTRIRLLSGARTVEAAAALHLANTASTRGRYWPNPHAEL